MERLVISLPESQKLWLERHAKKECKSLAQVIRDGLTAIQQNAEQQKQYQRLAKKVQGTWKSGDGLAYQLKIRAEED